MQRYALSEMTDSPNSTGAPQARRGGTPGKRERLVEGARLTFHEQGVEGTTIADIAQAAEVPVGNVYYHFKTKDELVQAAIDSHAQDLHERLGSREGHR